jgi:hypothetical protein
MAMESDEEFRERQRQRYREYRAKQDEIDADWLAHVLNDAVGEQIITEDQRARIIAMERSQRS